MIVQNWLANDRESKTTSQAPQLQTHGCFIVGCSFLFFSPFGASLLGLGSQNLSLLGELLQFNNDPTGPFICENFSRWWFQTNSTWGNDRI